MKRKQLNFERFEADIFTTLEVLAEVWPDIDEKEQIAILVASVLKHIDDPTQDDCHSLQSCLGIPLGMCKLDGESNEYTAHMMATIACNSLSKSNADLQILFSKEKLDVSRTVPSASAPTENNRHRR